MSMSTLSLAVLLFILSNGINGFGAVGNLFTGSLNSKVVYCNVNEFTLWGLEGLCHEFVK